MVCQVSQLVVPGEDWAALMRVPLTVMSAGRVDGLAVCLAVGVADFDRGVAGLCGVDGPFHVCACGVGGVDEAGAGESGVVAVDGAAGGVRAVLRLVPVRRRWRGAGLGGARAG